MLFPEHKKRLSARIDSTINTSDEGFFKEGQALVGHQGRMLPKDSVREVRPSPSVNHAVQEALQGDTRSLKYITGLDLSHEPHPPGDLRHDSGSEDELSDVMFLTRDSGRLYWQTAPLWSVLTLSMALEAMRTSAASRSARASCTSRRTCIRHMGMRSLLSQTGHSKKTINTWE
ncbi:hypothetical protein EYF80_059946 [Liparis tanakae]|uniref:Uncharacterized protein n=1 Tax=Liparis tanakae TaxID=230148 RepID=A0A4Z2EMB4_9TELE|nr:hypothetical protein EYF80_059946 [Liparis tanakae]